ncbi:MAG: hypothetical protein M1151_02280 [Candidatus Thermoplasmatota archaeon]|jgi:hypothetical protein|nr:hypothetical protein [Candidatus Thermoplasmatota archaeon]
MDISTRNILCTTLDNDGNVVRKGEIENRFNRMGDFLDGSSQDDGSAKESIGFYEPLYNFMESRGFEIKLANLLESNGKVHDRTFQLQTERGPSRQG